MPWRTWPNICLQTECLFLRDISLEGSQSRRTMQNTIAMSSIVAQTSLKRRWRNTDHVPKFWSLQREAKLTRQKFQPRTAAPFSIPIWHFRIATPHGNGRLKDLVGAWENQQSSAKNLSKLQSCDFFFSRNTLPTFRLSLSGQQLVWRMPWRTWPKRNNLICYAMDFLNHRHLLADRMPFITRYQSRGIATKKNHAKHNSNELNRRSNHAGCTS